MPAKCARPLVLFVLFAFLPAGAQVPTAQSGLDRWAAALGGCEKLQALRGIYTKSRVEMGGMSGDRVPPPPQKLVASPLAPFYIYLDEYMPYRVYNEVWIRYSKSLRNPTAGRS